MTKEFRSAEAKILTAKHTKHAKGETGILTTEYAEYTEMGKHHGFQGWDG